MSPPTEKETRFIGFLNGLVADEDRAALAALRKGLGRSTAEAMPMYRYIVPWLAADASPREEQAYYLVASLFAWHQLSWSGERNLGSSFAILARKQRDETGAEPAGLDSRFTALLNSHYDDLDEHLRRAIGLLKAKEIPVDWAQLLHDIQRWHSPGAWVQRAWAKSFWAGSPRLGVGDTDQLTGESAGEQQNTEEGD